MLKALKKSFSDSSRAKRGKLFLEKLRPGISDKILDLGGGDGSHIYSFMKGKNSEITIADISSGDLKKAEDNYGYKTKVLEEGGRLPFQDREFNIVFCNSVIEHVTISKTDVWAPYSSRYFERLSLKRQKEFADEISRISESYFVQTPHKYFLIESHSWLPGFVVFLPRPILIKVLRFFSKFWPKKTKPDWNLLTYKQMQEMFPDAEIIEERKFGFTKSLIAIRNLPPSAYPERAYEGLLTSESSA